MFYEGLLEALPTQSPLRWRVNRSWYPYGILKKEHTILDHHAILAVLTLGQACELMGPCIEKIRRERLSSNSRSSGGFYQVSEARAGRARVWRAAEYAELLGGHSLEAKEFPASWCTIFSTLYVDWEGRCGHSWWLTTGNSCFDIHERCLVLAGLAEVSSSAYLRLLQVLFSDSYPRTLPSITC